MSEFQCPACGVLIQEDQQHDCPYCGHSNVPEWIRIVHAEGHTMTLTGDHNPMSRATVYNRFRAVKAPGGELVAAYFPSSGEALFTISKTENGWHAVGAVHRNHVLVDGVRLEGVPVVLTKDCTLEIFAESAGAVIASFTVRFPG